WSKSTNVSTGQIWARRSSRVTRSPAPFSRISSTCKGWPCRRSFTPFLRSSPARTSSSKAPNRNTRVLGVDVGISTSTSSAESTTILEFRSVFCIERKRLCLQQLINGENFGDGWRQQGLTHSEQSVRVAAKIAGEIQTAAQATLPPVSRANCRNERKKIHDEYTNQARFCRWLSAVCWNDGRRRSPCNPRTGRSVGRVRSCDFQSGKQRGAGFLQERRARLQHDVFHIIRRRRCWAPRQEVGLRTRHSHSGQRNPDYRGEPGRRAPHFHGGCAIWRRVHSAAQWGRKRGSRMC